MPGAVVSRHVDQVSLRQWYLDIVWIQFNCRVGILYGVAILFELDVCLGAG